MSYFTNEPALDVDCPVCRAAAGQRCHGRPVPHLERRDAADDPGPFGVLDLDGDGTPGALDPDDPGFWL